MTDIARLLLLGLLVPCVACNGPNRLAAPGTATSPSTVQSFAKPDTPPRSGPAVVYQFTDRLTYPVSGYTTMSQYVLYETGAFSLRYASLQGEYLGAYSEENGSITFRFAGDARWQATGSFDGDALQLRYNDNMQLSDFENAIYKRSP